MKDAIKFLVGFLFLTFVDLPLYLIYKLLFLSNIKCFTSISEFISLFPGYIGYFIRKGFYFLTINSGRNFDVGFGTILQYPSIRIGNDVYIGQNCNIAKCSIRDGVKIGSSVHIVNKRTHSINDSGDIMPTNIKDLERVRIGDKSWIGNCAVVLADVGRNCVIGAGSVVVKPIPDNCVAAGNPAKVIRERSYTN